MKNTFFLFLEKGVKLMGNIRDEKKMKDVKRVKVMEDDDDDDNAYIFIANRIFSIQIHLRKSEVK